MPRYRLEGRPRHRAKRQGFWPVRRVRFDVGLTPARALTRPGAARPQYGRIVRGAMLTPWFAVSVGIVVATSLTLAAPHPALTFPPPRSGHCAHSNCSSTSVPPKGRAPAIKHVNPLPAPPLPDAQRTTANVRAAVKVNYELLPRHHDRFMAVILIRGRKSLGKWEMRFRLPGAHIESIMWARWARDGADGVVVAGSPLPWPRSGANEARLVIFGSGKPRWPTGCSFDGGGCTFRKLTGDVMRHAGLRPGYHDG